MIDQRMRLAEREQDERRLLLEQARAGDLLAAAEFMEPEEGEKVCREWLASEDRYAFSNPDAARHYWTIREREAPWLSLGRTIFPAVELDLEAAQATTKHDQTHPEEVHEADSLPALCRWLRDNLPRLRAEAGL